MLVYREKTAPTLAQLSVDEQMRLIAAAIASENQGVKDLYCAPGSLHSRYTRVRVLTSACAREVTALLAPRLVISRPCADRKSDWFCHDTALPGVNDVSEDKVR